MSNRGRPANPPTDKESEKVKELLGVDAPLADIAVAVKRSVPWLRKYFSDEINSRKNNRRAPPKPERKISQAERDKVIRYVGCKMSIEDVARVMDMTPEELKAYFPDEIASGQAKYRAKVLDKLDAQMDVGTVGATNRLEALTVIPEPADPAAARQGPNLGKKAAAAANAGAAAAAGGVFAPPAPPRLAVDNTRPK